MQEQWYVAIGASGGQGMRDISEIVSHFPSDLDAVVLVVLHRPWTVESQMAEVLGRRSALPVNVCAPGQGVAPGQIYIGHPSEHITLAPNGMVTLVSDPDRAFGNRTIDLLFKSVAEHAGRHMIGIVLSGALDDGSTGLAEIQRAGGTAMVVTPGSPPNDGMPKNAMASGDAIYFVGTPAEIAAEVVRLVHPRQPEPERPGAPLTLRT